MPDRRHWVLTGSDARSLMPLDIVAKRGPSLALGEDVEVASVAPMSELIHAVEHLLAEHAQVVPGFHRRELQEALDALTPRTVDAPIT